MKLPIVVACASVLLLCSIIPAGAQDDIIGADQCLGCHNDERMLLIFRTPHGQGADANAPFASLQCESCHGSGGDHAGKKNVGAGHAVITTFGTEDGTLPEQQNAVCLDCHTSDVGMPWSGSMHERNDIACANCHSVHMPNDPVTSMNTQAEVCYDCHAAQKADSMKPYVHPLRFDLMTCSSCHNPHHSTGDALLKRDTVNELCWSCHTDLKGPFLFEHAPASEDCALCHRPHGSIHPALLNQRPPLLCQSCHSQSGHPSLSITPNSLPGNSPSPFAVGGSCLNCHRQIHGSNHPSGTKLTR
ncbi:MAG: cystathionine beta-synthase [Gammaproteobacteria bacterium]|nr:MAG: cystathionine beta-synthase [Gammaproteobacteria bacterium]RLA35646.1 MAG: cystathionine beta-synthase [Gammaproteobacteria bacterium]